MGDFHHGCIGQDFEHPQLNLLGEAGAELVYAVKYGLQVLIRQAVEQVCVYHHPGAFLEQFEHGFGLAPVAVAPHGEVDGVVTALDAGFQAHQSRGSFGQELDIGFAHQFGIDLEVPFTASRLAHQHLPHLAGVVWMRIEAAVYKLHRARLQGLQGVQFPIKLAQILFRTIVKAQLVPVVGGREAVGAAERAAAGGFIIEYLAA